MKGEVPTAVSRTPQESPKTGIEAKSTIKPKEQVSSKIKQEGKGTVEDELKKEKERILTAVSKTPQESLKIPKEKKAVIKPDESKLVKLTKEEVLTAVSRTSLEDAKVQRETDPPIETKERESDEPLRTAIAVSETPQAVKRGESKLIEEKPKEDKFSKPKKEEVLTAVSRTPQYTTRKRKKERPFEDKKNELNKKKEETVTGVLKTPQETAKIQREARPVKPKDTEQSRQDVKLKAASDKRDERTKGKEETATGERPKQDELDKKKRKGVLNKVSKIPQEKSKMQKEEESSEKAKEHDLVKSIPKVPPESVKMREEGKGVNPKLEQKDNKQKKEELKTSFDKQEIEKHQKEALVKEKLKVDDLLRKEEATATSKTSLEIRVEEKTTVKLKEHELKKEQGLKTIAKNVDEEKEIPSEKTQDCSDRKSDAHGEGKKVVTDENNLGDGKAKVKIVERPPAAE
ncbi:unnamed protein product, partial [Cylicostephanus goldi]